MSSYVNGKVTVKDLIMIPIKPFELYWYLYVLVFLYIIMHWAWGLNCNKNILLGVFTMVSIAGSCITVDLIFPFKSIMFYSVFFYIGIMLADNRDRVPPKAVQIVTYVLAAGILFCSAYFNVCIRNIPAVGVFASAIVSLGFIWLFEYVKFLGESRLLDFCGRYSLEIYLFHTYIASGNRVILPKLGITYFPLNVAVNFLMAVMIPIGCGLVLKKMKLHKLFFRPATFFSDLRDKKRAGNG